jgi:hypothetical protein
MRIKEREEGCLFLLSAFFCLCGGAIRYGSVRALIHFFLSFPTHTNTHKQINLNYQVMVVAEEEEDMVEEEEEEAMVEEAMEEGVAVAEVVDHAKTLWDSTVT